MNVSSDNVFFKGFISDIEIVDIDDGITSIKSDFVFVYDKDVSNGRKICFYFLGEQLNIIHDEPDDIFLFGRIVIGHAKEVLNPKI